MKHIRAQMRQGRKAGIFALLAAACLLLVLPACQNPAQRHGNRTGTVSLTFSQGLERTIMPPTGVAQFDRFELVFTRDVSEVRRVWTYNQLIAGTVELAAGEWFLTVTASRAFVVEDSAEPDGNGDGLEGFRRAAESEAIPVYVALGENTAVPVELNPIAGDGYKGTFRWNISFEYETRIKSAKLVIWEYADREYAVETFDLLNYDTGNYIVLPTGEYWVAVKLGSDSPRVGGGLGKALRVYYNMCSVMEDLEFGNADLSVSPLDLILLAWNGNEWDFSGIEAWEFGALEALSFAIVGVAGVDDGNFDHLEAAFNNVANWSEPFVAPDDAALLMQLVDAALINIGACKGFRGDALLYQPAVWTAIEAMVENETPIDYQWTNDDHTLTVNVGGEDGTAYVVVIDFGRTIPFLPPLTGTVCVTGTLQAGQTLTADTTGLGGSGIIFYQWMRENTVVGTDSTYTVQAADVGSLFTLRVSRAGNSGYITSLPILTGTVGITGMAHVGQTLTANIAELGGTGDIVFQWRRGTTNVGTNSSTYVVQTADTGFAITVTVTRTDNSGSAVSTPTAIVIHPPLTGTVSITGTAHVGQTLTANTGSLGGTGTVSFQWRRGTINLGNNSTYVLQPADVGSSITVTVTRTGNSGSVTSTPTAAVILPPLTGTVGITGTLQAGQTLTAVTTGLGGSGAISHQWMRGTTVVGTAATYTVQTADIGSTNFTLRVARANNSGNVTSLPMLAGTVNIIGTAHVGQTLTANIGNLGGSGTAAFQWRRGTINIGINSTYTVQAADVGSTITVTVTRANNSGSVTSVPTAVATWPPPGSVSVTPSSATLVQGVGGTRQFSAAVGPAGAPQAVTWTVSPQPAGVTISSAGLLTVGTGVSVPTLTVRATATGHPAVSGTATVTLTPPPNWIVSAGSYHAVAIREDGRLWAWGSNSSIGMDYGRTGLGMLAGAVFIPFPVGTAANWAYVSAGGRHTVAIRSDGSLWAWGNNRSGQLGDGTTDHPWPGVSNDRGIPVRIGTATNWRSVSAGGDHTVAITTTGELWAWGNNRSGQLGIGTTIYRNIPTRIGTETNWASVSASGNHTIAIRTDGTLWAWGDNSFGQLGDGTIGWFNSSTPTQIGNATNWAYVSTGENHTAAIRGDGSLWAWGNNQWGQLGDGTTTDRNSPVQIGEATNWVSVSAGFNHTVAIRGSGELWVWGGGIYGQLGDGTLTNRTAPVQIERDVTDWVSVSAGNRYTIAVRANRTLWAWGSNLGGRAGHGVISEDVLRPIQVREAAVTVPPPAVSRFAAASAGNGYTLVVGENGTLWAWGNSNNGRTGLGMSEGAPSAPLQVGTATNWSYVSAGNRHTAAIRRDGSLWAWGYNGDGRLGDGTETATWMGAYNDRGSPVRIGTATNWRSVSAGGSHTMAIRTDGTLWAWGGNNRGKLGDGTETNRNIPTRIGNATNWATVSAGYSHTVALRTDGTLWAWGDGFWGQLGDGTNSWSNNTPTQIGNATNWVYVSAGSRHTVAIRRDGTLWAWGHNSFGQLGDGTTADRNTPVQVGEFTNWVSVSAGTNHTMAIREGGTLWAWGQNGSGELGDGTGINRSSPGQIGNESNWASVFASSGDPIFSWGNGHTLAIRTDGTLWVWGSNDSGQLGDGTMTNRLYPFRITIP